ncbi:MAG: efflux RND transporter periplasmic adaptor subunit [Hahellaceae bacterium]|nr:efflux RND transporter periplasmic adaptor subunit [Hahellaceae bacterium]
MRAWFWILSIAMSLVACQPASVPTPQKAKPVHLVEITPVHRRTLDITRQRTGTLRARREVEIHSQEAGRITFFPFYESDRVKAGEVVARLDDTLLKAALAKNHASRKQTEQEWSRLSALHQKQLVSAEVLEAKETELQVLRADEQVLQTRLGYTVIRASMDGVISQRLSEEGNVAESYAHLLTLSDPTSLVTEVTVSELLLSSLKVNAPVSVSIDALGGQAFKGKILRIHPNVDPVTRRGRLEVEVHPVPEGARPGQLCRVTFSSALEGRLAVPFRALRRDEQGAYLYTLNKDNLVERRDVISGMRFNDQVEITQGVSEGDRVVTRGFLGLTEQTQVEVVSTTTGAP